ncbi:MAG: hypothetical protein ACJ8CR_17505, partial [Roseiflexaceae bacterium]
MNTRIWLAALMLIALAQGLVYVFIVPIWQAPDEPMLYEYAALAADLGRVPRVEDRSPALEERLAGSLARQRFWHYRVAQEPAVPPHTLEGVQALFPMPRQVGGDPPLYFVLAALPLRLVAGWPPERQVLLLRLLNGLLLPALVACAYGAARELCDDDRRPTTDHRRRSPFTPSPLHLVARSPAHPLARSGRMQYAPTLVPLAVASLVALHPMLAVIGASLSNDGLANLLGAALCWAILRLLRRGANVRRVVLAAGLLGLGLLSKRTMLPYLPLLLAIGLGWALTRRPPTADRRPPTADSHGAGGHRAGGPSVAALYVLSSRFSFHIRPHSLRPNHRMKMGDGGSWFSVLGSRFSVRPSRWLVV